MLSIVGIVLFFFLQVSKKFGLLSKNLPLGASASSGTPDSSGGPAYVFNGVYQPLACKLVQEAIKPSNPKVSITESLKELQIPHKMITGRSHKAILRPRMVTKQS
jgi:hypothetical protein